MKYKKRNLKNVGLVSKTVLSLCAGLLAHATVHATEPASGQSCDISVESELIEQTNEQLVETFRSDRDRVGRAWRDRLEALNRRNAEGYLLFAPVLDRAYCREFDLYASVNDHYRYYFSYEDDGSLLESNERFSSASACQAALDASVHEIRTRIVQLRHDVGAVQDHSWDEAQRAEVTKACNQRIVSQYANTLLPSIGGVPRSREYYCTQPVEVLFRHGKFRAWESRLMRFTPVYRTISDEEFSRIRCEKIRGCSIRAQSAAALREAEELWIGSSCDLQTSSSEVATPAS